VRITTWKWRIGPLVSRLYQTIRTLLHWPVPRTVNSGSGPLGFNDIKTDQGAFQTWPFGLQLRFMETQEIRKNSVHLDGDHT